MSSTFRKYRTPIVLLIGIILLVYVQFILVENLQIEAFWLFLFMGTAVRTAALAFFTPEWGSGGQKAEVKRLRFFRAPYASGRSS